MTDAGKQVFEWVHKEKPEEMCVTAGFCPAASLLAMYQPQLSGFAKTVFPVQKEDQCNTCQLVILEASSVLSDPVSYSTATHSTCTMYINGLQSLCMI